MWCVLPFVPVAWAQMALFYLGVPSQAVRKVYVFMLLFPPAQPSAASD